MARPARRARRKQIRQIDPRLIIGGALLIIAGAIGLMVVTAQDGDGRSASAANGAEVSAPDFTLPGLTGQVALADFRGQYVLLNFWASWCPPCLAEMPAMERLWQHHRDSGFMMVAVSVDADPAKVKPFVAEHKLTFPIALDPRMEVAAQYGVRALPSSFLVDRAGNLAGLAIGPRAWDNDASHSLVEGLVR